MEQIRKPTPRMVLMLIRNPKPMPMVTMFTMNSTMPKDSQRRMRFRSLTMRDSSCPLCQRSWNATGRSCSLR
jgi:hypothetical protein